MTYPEGVVTRVVNFGPAFSIEEGELIQMKVTIQASRAMVWLATGAPAIITGTSVESDVAGVNSHALPVTDQIGWGDGRGGAIDVSGGKHSHTYQASLGYFRNGKEITRKVTGPFVVPTGDDPIDLDNLVPAGGGVGVSIPLNPGSGGGGGGGFDIDMSDVGYDLILLVGQSKMQGDTLGAVDPLVDVADPRVYTYNASGEAVNSISQALDPLGHLDDGATVVGPGTSFGRWYAGCIPGNRRVLLVPCGHNATGMISGSSLLWNVDAGELFEDVIIRGLGAKTAAGPNAKIVGCLFDQGETDAIEGVLGATYQAALVQFIEQLRVRLGVPQLPVVIGSLSANFLANYAAPTKVGIDAAHKAIPGILPFTSFVQGPAGSRGDNIHYTPAESREMGRRFVVGLDAALANTLGEEPEEPEEPADVATIVDDFARAASAISMGSTSTGNVPWVVQEGPAWGITAEQMAYCPGGLQHSLVAVETGELDGKVEATVAVRDAGSAVCWRVVDGNNWIGVLITPGLTQVCKRVGGAVSLVGGAFGSADGDVWRVEYSASDFVVFRNDVQVQVGEDNSLLTGTKVGFRADTGAARFDSISFIPGA